MIPVARKDSWKTEGAFGELEPLPYRASFSAEEFARIKAGLIPVEMEDKWFIYFEEPSLFLHRSWSGQGMYRIDFEIASDGAHVRRAYRVLRETADDPQFSARLLAFLVSNLLLGRNEPFPVPDGETNPSIFQHVMAGTGYPSVPVRSRRKQPWWKLWSG